MTTRFPFAGMPEPERVLFIRLCYDKLATAVMKQLNNTSMRSIAVLGTSGAGVQHCFAYCVYRLTEMIKQSTPLVVCVGGKSFKRMRDGWQALSDDLARREHQSFNTVLLTDTLGSGHSVARFVLFASSSSREPTKFLNIKLLSQHMLHKPVNEPLLVMPTWRDVELHAAKHVLAPSLDNNEVDRRFHLFGGLPRFVFADDPSKDEATVRRAVAMADLTLMERAQREHAIVLSTNPDRRVRWLFHWTPIHKDGEPFHEVSTTVASTAVHEKMRQRVEELVMATQPAA